jgi:hypothetical protein
MESLPPSPRLTALRIALLFSRTKKTRGRITQKTFALVSEREKHTASFEIEVRNVLEEFSIIMFPILRGGFGLVKTSALEGAQVMSIKNNLSESIFSGKSWNQLTDNEIFSIISSCEDDKVMEEE